MTGRARTLGWVLFGGLLPLAASEAQEIPATLTLEDAVELATRHNPAYRSASNDLGPAEWSVRESYGAFLPHVSASASGQYLAPGSPTFGIFSAQDIGLDVTDYYFSGYSLTASYTLDGRNLFRVASARADRKATQARIEAEGYGLQSAVTTQYLEALRAQDALETARRQLERARENYELATARVEVGAAVPVDAKQAEVELGRARVAVLEAESTARIEKLRLLERIGLSGEGDFELVSEFEVFDPPWKRAELEQMALGSHPRLRALRAEGSAREADAKLAWSGYLPTLYLSANWSGRAREIGDHEYLLSQARGAVASRRSDCERWNQVSAGLSQPLDGYPRDCSAISLTPEQEASILASNDVFPFDWSPEPWSLYLQVSFPVFQGFRRQREIREARAAAEDARLDLREEELRLRTAVSESYDAVLTAREVVEIEARNREVAEEQVQLARERYRLGAAPFLELLEAMSSLAEAERDYLDARYRFHGSVTALETAVGRRLRSGAGGR